MTGRMTPRNLTARLRYRALGNPANAGLASGVGNCFPGLEFDVRNLDRRFFPGILWQFVTTPLRPVPSAPPNQQGVRAYWLDWQLDPMLPDDSPEPWVQTLLAAYKGEAGSALAEGRWYLEWVEQRDKRISMADTSGEPLDGEICWRIVRSIEPDIGLKVGLVRRDAPDTSPPPRLTLSGYRRKYLGKDGVPDRSYRAGELTQSLCNPWSHDFRDCGCHYWAANHPDVTLGPVDEKRALPTGQSKDPWKANTYLDWIRADRSASGRTSSFATYDENRPYQMDAYFINQHWQELPYVLDGREIGDVYEVEAPKLADPYDGPEELIHELEHRLAPLEMTLAVEYLYAMWTVKTRDEVPTDRWPTMADDVAFARQFVLLVAAGEMKHLRLANRLLWSLYDAGYYPKGKKYEPVVRTSRRVPGGPEGTKRRELRPLTLETIADFMQIERPGSFVDTAYAQVCATLKTGGYPEHLYEIAVRIDTDGTDHYSRFCDVLQTMRSYQGANAPYLRDVHVVPPEEAQEALERYSKLVRELETAYAVEAAGKPEEAQSSIRRSRTLMTELQEIAEHMASEGKGIPFFSV